MTVTSLILRQGFSVTMQTPRQVVNTPCGAILVAALGLGRHISRLAKWQASPPFRASTTWSAVQPKISPLDPMKMI